MKANDDIYFAKRIKVNENFEYVAKKGKIIKIVDNWWNYIRYIIRYDIDKTMPVFPKYVFNSKNECEEFCKFSNERLVIQRECRKNINNLRRKNK